MSAWLALAGDGFSEVAIFSLKWRLRGVIANQAGMINDVNVHLQPFIQAFMERRASCPPMPGQRWIFEWADSAAAFGSMTSQGRLHAL